MRPALRLAALLLLAGALAGCVNLAEVRRYTDAAGPALADTSALQRWRDSEQHLDAQVFTSPGCPAPAITGRPAQADLADAARGVAQLQAVLGAWEAALGALASSQPPLPGPALTGTLAGLRKAGLPVTEAEQAAVSGLAALLDRGLDTWRQARLRELVDRSTDDADQSLALLQRIAQLFADDLRGERVQALQRLACQRSPAGELRDVYLGRREQARLQAAYDADEAALAAWQRALGQVRQDHQKLRTALALDGAALQAALQDIAATARTLQATTAALQRLHGDTP